MDRDMDAIRQIILAVKDSDSPIKSVPEISADVFNFNAMLLIEAGFAQGVIQESSRRNINVPSLVLIYRLTWDGFEFADSIKDDELWAKAKKFILKPAGSWTVGILSEYLKQEIKNKFGLS